LRSHTGSVTSVAFHPGSGRLASAAYDAQVKIWNLQNLQEERTLRGHPSWIYAVRFSPDGRTLASAGKDGDVILWDTSTGATLRSLKHASLPIQIAFSADSRLLAVACRLGDADRHWTAVRIWDTATGQQVGERRGKPQPSTAQGGSEGCGVGFSSDGRYMAWSSGDRLIRVEETASGQEVLHCRGGKGWGLGILEFSSDSRHLASPEGKGVCIWDLALDQRAVANGAEATALPVRDPRTILKGHQRGITSIGFNHNTQRLVTTSGDGLVKLWDANDGTEMLALEQEANQAVFNPDGNLLAIANTDYTIMLLNGMPFTNTP
jgi:WD40 repeat protein